MKCNKVKYSKMRHACIPTNCSPNPVTQYADQKKWPFTQQNITFKKRSRKYRLMIENLQFFSTNSVSSVLQDFNTIHLTSEKTD